MKLILIRHGQTDHNVGLRLTGWGDPPLDETGLVQAEALAVQLTQEHKIDGVWSSPLIRARQTAAPLLKQTGLNLRIHAGLKELYFGEVEGMTIPQVKETYPDLLKSWSSPDEPDFAWPGGETRMVFHTRVDRAVWSIMLDEAEAGHECVAVVAHGGSVAGFISELQTGQPYAWRKFLLTNCQYCIVEVHYEGLPLRRENCTLQVTYIGELAPIRSNE